ncbi:hypothetical protein AGDE_01715 [Angomonas deanei]|uniref:RecQ-mediated genome instability protein 1 n=1 Tax=Angomonas deanei TaxID=59799 RepID=A0A7G2CH74_9TRYP|nr:hypothetical protein AGDE_01715 [Angomonas deanei]CAD2219106.1 RecQ mediated genome instability protein, putative [Angomonas deanei]|eukprot:EPY42208.1 hypothetical protein AGDE_01715 [Angomonas deanei]
MAAICAELKGKYFVSVSQEYVERITKATPSLNAETLYKRILSEDIKEFCDSTSALPYGIASHSSAVLPDSVVLQITSARDATQPLRPCAGSDELEEAVAAAGQRSTSNRLLKLVLTDGTVEIPAAELTTLSTFKGIPIPGEKLLIKAGAEVRSGYILLTEENVVLLGGEVAQLKRDYLNFKKRKDLGYKLSGGLEGVPLFEPLVVGSNAHRNNPYDTHSSEQPHAYHDRGGRGQRGRGRGQHNRGRGHAPRGGNHSRGRSDAYNSRRGRGYYQNREQHYDPSDY